MRASRRRLTIALALAGILVGAPAAAGHASSSATAGSGPSAAGAETQASPSAPSRVRKPEHMAGKDARSLRHRRAEHVATKGVRLLWHRPAASSRPQRSGAVFVPDVPGGAAAPTRPATSAAGRVPVARAAGDPAVTIADFHFTQGATTVHVGDTVTWTNVGPSSHTATASDGSFDTGVLAKGQSGSHTFTRSGTFSYFCKIHPFMHGTIVVLAKASTSSPPAGAGSPQAPASAGPAAAKTPAGGQTPAGAQTPAAAQTPAGAQARSGSTLPVTGMNVSEGLAAGLLLIGAGLTLRRAVRALR